MLRKNEKAAVVWLVQLINIRSSISAQQTWINIHLSLGGQNNSHHAALLSTNRRARSVGRLPSRWPSAGINDISGYTHLTNDNQLANFNNHVIYGSTWNCITGMLTSRSEYIWSFPFSKRYLHITRPSSPANLPAFIHEAKFQPGPRQESH